MTRFKPLYLALIILACVLLLDIWGLPSHTRLWRALQNLGHIPIFALVALAIFYLLERVYCLKSSQRRWWQYGLALCLTVLIGALIEFKQLFTQRDASWLDILYNTLGAVLCLSMHALFQQQEIGLKPRWVLRGLLLLCAAGLLWVLTPIAILSIASVHQRISFPVLLEFDSIWERSFIRAENADLSFVSGPLPWQPQLGGHYLRIQFQAKPYSGIWLQEPYPHWQEYDLLAFNLYSQVSNSFSLTIRIHDYLHNYSYSDRFNRTIIVQPGANHIQIPLQAVQSALVGRTMNLQKIAALGLFVSNPELDGRAVWIDQVALKSY